MTRKTRPSLDAMLSDALRPQAGMTPMPDGVLDLPDGWVRGRGVSAAPALAAAAVVTVAVIATIAVLTLFTGVLPEPRLGPGDDSEGAGLPIERLDVEPRPGAVREGELPAIGPVVDVARGRVGGRGFTVTVYRGEAPNDVCLRFEYRPDYSHVCGSMPGESPLGGQSFGMATTFEDSLAAHEVTGVVATEVAAVWIETSDGGRLGAELIDLAPADIKARLFIAFLPGGVDPQAYVAADVAGNEIDRIDLMPGPPDTSGPPPTPGSSPSGSPPSGPSMPPKCGLGDGIELGYSGRVRFEQVWGGTLPPEEAARIGDAYVSAGPIDIDGDTSLVLCFLTEESVFVGGLPDDWESPR